MKFSWFSCLLFLAAFSAISIGCDKDKDPVVTPPPPVKAGKGGNNTLRIVPIHSGNNIDSCFLYIKYNALDMPSFFDDSVYCTYDSKKEFSGSFTNLQPGNYFLYAKGWDVITSENVEDYMYHVIVDQSSVHTIKMPIRTAKK
jgi:hypothetical protein